MKILFVCQHYTPEPFRHPDFCEDLVRRGHEVRVLTGVPNYPMGEIYEGYRHGEKRDEVLNGVQVHRCFTIGRKTGTVRRVLNYYSFAISSSLAALRLKEDFDVVMVTQPSPVMMASAGIRYKKKHRKKMLLYCMDLWPECLCVGGIRRGGLIYRYYHRVSERIYRQADSLLITSKSFAGYFDREFGIRDTVYLPQFAEAIFTPEQCRKEPDGFVDLMFAGNLGIAQSIGTIIEAARLLKDERDIRFHIVGDGSEFERLKQQAEGLENVIFYGRKPLGEMPRYYSMADAMLVTMQKNPVVSFTLPGKVQTYMAAGKPILGAIDGETPLIVGEAGCGFCAPAEDSRALADLCLRFRAEKNNTQTYARNARSYYLENFSRELFCDRLEKKLKECIPEAAR